MINATGIHHIGIAVRSIEEQRPFYEQVLGGRYEGTVDVPDQHVRVGFFVFGESTGSCRVELLEPTGDDSPIAKFLEKRGPGLHHLAYRVSDIDARLDELKRSGFPLIDERPRIGAHGNLIAFLHPQYTYGALTELCQPKDE